MTNHDIDTCARTLYGEARGEYKLHGPAAFIAVANVILNRYKRGGKYGNTIADICLKPRQFSCWDQKDPNRLLIQDENITCDPLFNICLIVARKVIEGLWPDLTRGSDHYHSSSCLPYWARSGKVKLRLGNHIFYKLEKDQ